MKTRHLILFALAVAAAGAAGWFAASHWSPPSHATEPQSTTRKVLYYQSSMHPWIKSDKPGRCTICGMALSPVFEGDKGFDSTEGIITLGSNTIQVINVQTDEVKRRPLHRAFRFAGTIDDNDARHRIVSAYVDGRIDKLSVNFVGAEVMAGQPLATFYSPMLLAAEREYVALAHQHSLTPAAPHGGDPQRLLDTAISRLKRYGLDDSQIDALTKKNPNNIQSSLLAPMTGTVVARFVYEGQYVKEGEKLFEIADFSTMWFQFDAYERDLSWLKPGQQVEVTTPALPGRTFTGVLVFIDPNLKEMTRSAKVRVEMPNPLIETNGTARRELYHKLYADASVQVQIPEVLTVPRSAVLSPGATPVVYVDKGGGAYEQRKVRLGRAGDDDYEVLDGLSTGEQVVTQGNMLIDAQAQLNASANVSGIGHQHTVPSTSSTNGQPVRLPSLTADQQRAAQEFIKLADDLTAALAADNLAEFNSQSMKTHVVLPVLASAFTNDSSWRPLVSNIQASGHLASSTDLKAARKAFHPMSMAAVGFVKALRKQDGVFKDIKVFRCPMTKDAFPGAPRTAEWLQLAVPIRNPYFGAEMLDCGSEVKP